MSKVIKNGLAHFRAKLNRHLKIVNACYAEIARLEALQLEGNPTTLAVDTARPPLTEEALQILEQCLPYVREN